MATSPEHLFAARRDMFPMSSKPVFFLQDAWDQMVLWVRTVGEMGLTEALNRLGRCVYNRWRLLRTASAYPGMQAESLGGVLKGPRKEKGPYDQEHPKAKKQQTSAPSKAQCFPSG
ncbi:hypothetical protein TRVL_08312 [Trypanosoma vivax]|nr:hypothetical protein TRVL_08312 [Trypanosoma vivax]